MSSDWERLESIVARASELDPDSRTKFVEEETQGDNALREEALAILEAGLADDAFLDPIIERTELPPGTQIGPFRIQRPIASGGMGVVYEATQESPARVVALKTMRADVISSMALARFQHEIEILGTLTHPGIAEIYQAGVHASVPWFAMEYVPDALPLVRFCREHQKPRADRIALVADVADAIHHGHVRGVMHRDLKPDNLLVGRDGRVRVIDFGVAGVTDPDLRLNTLQTSTGSIVGTLAYMSPEQARGESGDARSDLYSLGVVLYELLTGAHPIALSAKDFLSSARRIVEDPPTRPSAHDKALRGDLEAILLRALQKDPERRYASADALGNDLRAYLDRRPVSARSPSLVDHARSFVRRNRLLMGSITAITLALLAAAGVSIAFGIRSRRAESKALKSERTARAERDRAEQLLSQSLKQSLDATFDAVPAIHSLPGGAEAAGRVMKTTIDNLEALHRTSDGDERILVALAEAYAKLGDIQGNQFYAHLSDAKGAATSYERAIALLRKLDKAHGLKEATKRRAGLLEVIVLRKSTELHPGPLSDDARARLSRALELATSLASGTAPGRSAESQLALIQLRLAHDRMINDDFDAAAVLARRGVAIHEKHLSAPGDKTWNVELLAAALGRLGRIQVHQGRLREAETSYDRALSLIESLPHDEQLRLGKRRINLWMKRGWLARKQRDFKLAQRLVERAKTLATSRYKQDPKNPGRSIELCTTLSEWVITAEEQHGPSSEGTPPDEARARARAAADLVESLAPKSSRMIPMFAKPFREYAEGKQKAGALMGAFGR